MKGKGELTYRGNGNPWSITIRVGIADGEGGVQFGSESTVYIRTATYGGSGVEPAEYLVQIGGLSSHEPEFGRQRAAAYLEACSIAETFRAGMDRDGLYPFEVFKLFAAARHLMVYGNAECFAADEDEDPCSRLGGVNDDEA